jgi:hypothetical protein
MLKKVSFFIIILLCLLFTITIVNKLSLENTQVNPSAYFNDRDSTVFIINHPNNIDFTKDQIITLDCNRNLFQSIRKEIPENCSVFLSQKRGLMIFEASGNWNKASVKELFINGQHKIHFTKLRHFNFGPFNGFYSKNKLIIHTKEITPAKCSNGFIIDKEANYCTVSYEKKKPIVKDFYKSKGNTLSYSKVPGKAEKFKNIDDQEIFSHFISDNFNSYSFYEKEYFAALDPSFQQSPIYSLTASGLLILKNKGNTLAIIELKNGQKCTETLNETEANENSSGNYIYYKDLEISGVLDQKNKGGYYITDIDGFAIISKNKVFFDHVNTEIKLGNVLLKNKAKMDNLFMGLPQKVLFRNVNKQVEIAVAKVGKTIVEVEIINDNIKDSETNNQSKDYFAMNPRERIESFYAYSGRGNTFLITSNNKWIKYENGLSKWEKVFDREVVREPKLMEMSSNENQDISILFDDESLIIDKGGRILNRFNTSGKVHPIRFKLKNKVSFLIPNIDRMEVVDYDGKILSTYSFSSSIIDMVLFKENGKKHVAVLCENTFFVINLDRKRTARTIDLEEETYELYKFEEHSFIMNSDRSNLVNLKGEKINYNVPSGFQFKTVYQENESIFLVFSKENEILVLNQSAQFQWKRGINCSSIDKVVIPQLKTSNNSYKIILGILDGIENKILLLDSQGSALDNVKRHGEKDLQITNYGNQGISITTFLGDYLIQYAKF